MFLTTRRRLAIWYTTPAAILLLIFATGFYLYFRNTLIERIIKPTPTFSIGNSEKFPVNFEISFRDNVNF